MARLRLGLCRPANFVVSRLDGLQGLCKPLLQLSLANDPKECAEQSALEVLALALNHDVYVGRAVGLPRQGISVTLPASPQVRVSGGKNYVCGIGPVVERPLPCVH